MIRCVSTDCFVATSGDRNLTVTVAAAAVAAAAVAAAAAAAVAAAAVAAAASTVDCSRSRLDIPGCGQYEEVHTEGTVNKSILQKWPCYVLEYIWHYVFLGFR